MFPEIFGFLIIAGALLVLVVRVISKRQQSVDTEELRASTEQLKAELTRSADAVIARMGNHIQHLEELLRQADERNVRLEAGINEYKRLAGEMEDRSAALNRELTEARKMIAELAAYQSVPLVPQQPVMPMTSATPMQRVDAQDFAAVLQNSMNREEPAINAQQATGLAVAMTKRPEELAEVHDSAPQEIPEDEEEKVEPPQKSEPEKAISPNAAKAKALLRSGYSIEDTARETGMGRGAIELLREMNKRDLQ
jgi:valyl-tRNA synthetase